MKKLSYILNAIEMLVLISIIFLIHNNVIRGALFVFLIPILLINGQIKKQMYSENKNKFNDKNK
ncbi:hypothetical protein J2Z53_002188 [Clostridium moniliforme]|uniref:Uncharacterized protein n=1 Tax=Clostridium moniliforme TaxID=39489 RepID=A0ABS4F2X0_9CLOT|nr:hypothetical protein [Clostridium moniliforme]MBP1890583.1 hypothetical protein [Clostridium moniliforme]